MSSFLTLRVNKEMLTWLEFFFVVGVVIFKEPSHVSFSWFHLKSMLACFVLSQRIKARKLFETNFTLVCFFHSRCCMLLGKMIIQVSLRGCWEVGTLSAMKFSSWTSRLVSHNVLLCSLCPTFTTCNFFVAVQSRHCWRFLAILPKQNNLKK